MLDVSNAGLWYVLDSAMTEKPAAKVNVFHDPQTFVESADDCQPPPPHSEIPSVEGDRGESKASERSGVLRRGERSDRNGPLNERLGIMTRDFSGNGVKGTIGLERRDKKLKPAGIRNAVGVGKHQNLSGTLSHTAVSGPHLAPLFFVEQPYQLPAVREVLNNRPGTVGGAIVHNDDLVRRARLRQHGAQADLKCRLCIKSRDDDRNAHSSHTLPTVLVSWSNQNFARMGASTPS